MPGELGEWGKQGQDRISDERRERLADVVGIGLKELVAEDSGDQKLVLVRRIAAYFPIEARSALNRRHRANPEQEGIEGALFDGLYQSTHEQLLGVRRAHQTR